MPVPEQNCKVNKCIFNVKIWFTNCVKMFITFKMAYS